MMSSGASFTFKLLIIYAFELSLAQLKNRSWISVRL